MSPERTIAARSLGMMFIDNTHSVVAKAAATPTGPATGAA